MTAAAQPLLLQRRMHDAILAQGWPRRFLGWGGAVARLDAREGECGFVPFNRLTRLLNRRAFLPIRDLLRVGSIVRFDPLLARNAGFCGLGYPRLGEQFFGHDLHVRHCDRWTFRVESAGAAWHVGYLALCYAHWCFVSSDVPLPEAPRAFPKFASVARQQRRRIYARRGGVDRALFV